MKSIQWSNDCLCLLNQTALPGSLEYIDCRDHRRVGEAIKRLEVRGAPAIGAAAAFGLVLGARELAANGENLRMLLPQVAEELLNTRPTAVNLSWALKRMMAVLDSVSSDADIVVALEQEAVAIMEEDRQVNAAISRHGLELFEQPIHAILTHCNAGALATVEYGTALGVIRQAWANGKIGRVFADETRPLLQGARLTVWELMQDGIPVTLITDNMAGWVMKKQMVQAVIVGADRIALNGDVANKIGTYSVAVLAQKHNIPFYVAAPLSTFDFSLQTGDSIPIEERDSCEVAAFGGQVVAPAGVEVFNPAFDVTPHELITAIITEHGVLRPPFCTAIASIQKEKGGK
ncbi:methylthioribose-1-phosphate isomerase [Anaerosporomusa subterranea]|uniref:Methylthioribose-1-phosphate isomerase n=1 Tax=Anaerosporomusa subterranea TaxID=1794912 RepID=A0A154BTB2_ANASB|nr:S-methyl-5-thioribose-1-phosphate isomerase [Anaerosporomusa subterranea]KYZ77161.1 methylthioribose-1-phosphate isomerase [Anaerosporomusa subterranea]